MTEELIEILIFTILIYRRHTDPDFDEICEERGKHGR